MKIMGLQKTTLLDYPGHLAATIFLGGCNMRCPFCHNMDIVDASSLPEAVNPEEIFDFLKKRQNTLEGLCITGGEPTLNPELPDFITSVKLLGYKVKLDTNGTNPDMLINLIEQNLLDYVAMDIKSSLEQYSKLSGIPNIDTEKIKSSIKILNDSSIDHEYRTTIIKQYHTSNVIEEIGILLEGSNKHFLQNFKDSEYVPNHMLTGCTKEELVKYQSILKKYIKNVEIRGID